MKDWVKFLDVAAINERFLEAFHNDITEVVQSGRALLGLQTQKFEEEFAEYCHTTHCVGVANGLDALWLTLMAKKILEGWTENDEVIVPEHTFIATVQAVVRAGLKPILAPVSNDDYLLDVSQLTPILSSKTRAILPVHLYGKMADMNSIATFAAQHNLFILEDAAQAHGAQYAGHPAGDRFWQGAAAYSFYPGKNLGALGDGGAMVTNDESLANCVRQLANYGSSTKYHHEYMGTNSRLDELQAAFLRHKLRSLQEDNKKRRKIARRYLTEIKNPLISLPYPTLDLSQKLESVFHIFPIFSQHRTRLQEHLQEGYIETLIHYPIPIHKQQCIRHFWRDENDFLTAEQLANEELSLPISPVLSDEHVTRVIRALNTFEL
ncbi:DegT/DnrJ/EryC1/StrS family aminotransferase [Ihuprevotella massiliensis]|uniref:DegT/DnrJ/EryC1/StrS family aminotransferase n=1 Tax=Ihuprevotella massiliensis TaxID=1852368 RepID=UPI00094E9F65